MRFLPMKSEAQQASGVVFRARALLVWQRTQCINALRGHLSEYGYVVSQGITHTVNAVRMASGEDQGWPPRVVRGSAAQAWTASSVNHTFRLPR